jgi:hypothetical protein
MQRITLTGIDSNTNLNAIHAFLKKYPYLEIGVLYSAISNGHNRYPNLAVIWNLCASPHYLQNRFALHICGNEALSRLKAGELHRLIPPGIRIQVNGTHKPYVIQALCDQYPLNTIITQHNELNDRLYRDVSASNHEILIDSSCGTGVTPKVWSYPNTNKRIGFAGGLGICNLTDQLDVIENFSLNQPYWVDMETSLRDEDDWFSVDKAFTILETFDKYLMLQLF